MYCRAVWRPSVWDTSWSYRSRNRGKLSFHGIEGNQDTWDKQEHPAVKVTLDHTFGSPVVGPSVTFWFQRCRTLPHWVLTVMSRFPPTLIATLILTLNTHFTYFSYNLKIIWLRHAERQGERNAASWKLMQKNDWRRKWSMVSPATGRSSKISARKLTEVC